MNEEKDIELDKENLDDSVVAEEHQDDQIKKLKEKLKQAEEKAKEYLDGWQRERAEIANARKRDEEARGEFLKFANADLIHQLLPVLDSLELSLPHGNKELEAIYKQTLQILKQNGLEESMPIGEIFNPRLHESVGTIKVDKKEEDHKILEVIQKGYILSPNRKSDASSGAPVGKIIRPAKVKIGEYHD
ncbi:MAG: nucleotide exchange factor GrpE [Candidatus Zambryskibacteria bacterium]|nr:nucleotide exchange factor GrpE [Candidatus Zambryskibacteria bacterium]